LRGQVISWERRGSWDRIQYVFYFQKMDPIEFMV
jgi:hypothetical protein